MSCYNWERGSIVIPSKDWSAFRKNLLTAWNGKQDEMFEDAKRAHTAAVAAAKGKRGKNREEAIVAALVVHCGGRMDGSYEDFRSESARERYDAIRSLVYKYDWQTRTSTLGTPKKADLKKVTVTKDARIDLPDATVTFTAATRTVTWDVSENNRAVEHAHEHWFAKKLFAALDRIEWNRGSGGTIYGNDEYNRDPDNGPRGGGNYVTREYRMKTAAEKKAAAAAGWSNPSYRSYGSGRW